MRLSLRAWMSSCGGQSQIRQSSLSLGYRYCARVFSFGYLSGYAFDQSGFLSGSAVLRQQAGHFLQAALSLQLPQHLWQQLLLL